MKQMEIREMLCSLWDVSWPHHKSSGTDTFWDFVMFSSISVGLSNAVPSYITHTYILLSRVTEIVKLRGFSPQANYTDRATAACRRS
jgi:hypothetical protein